jgi:cell volume regulation protein A
MIMEVSIVLMIAGAIIILGFLGNAAFEKTKIPDVLLLLSIGILLGPVLNVIHPDLVKNFAEYFGTFALVVIIFEGGMDIKIRLLINEFVNASLLVLLSFALTVAAITAYLYYIQAWALTLSLMLATILGCTSAAIVVPVIGKIRLKEDIKTVLFVESAMSDVLAVVFTISLIEFSALKTFGIEQPFRTIASSFSVAIVAGMLSGVIWFKILNFLENRQYSYMVTMGATLMVYSLTDFLGGSGIIAILIFGIVIGNCSEFPFMKLENHCLIIDDTIKFFHGEVTFFIRTFFYVYLGMMVNVAALRLNYLLTSLALLAVIVVVRYISVVAMTRLSRKDMADAPILIFMFPRGLASAVLAILPAAAGIKGSEDFIIYAISLIILTNIIMTVGVFHQQKILSGRKQNDP